MNIVLYQPEIPYNTGNIGRSCVLTNTTLHLIKPLGFSLDEKQVKRAGMDYWHLVDLKVWESFEEFLEANKGIRLFYATTKTGKFRNPCKMCCRIAALSVPDSCNRMSTADQIFDKGNKNGKDTTKTCQARKTGQRE